MKKLICWLCILALLLCMLSLVGCTEEEVEGEETPPTADAEPAPEKGTGDDKVLNDNVTTDDVHKDIFAPRS